MNTTNYSTVLQIGELSNKEFYSVVISGLLVCSSGASVIAMLKAPKIPSNIRYLSINIILYDVLLLGVYILHIVFMDNPKWLYFRLDKMCVFNGAIAVAGFSTERYIALSTPLLYQKYCRKLYIKAFVFLELFYSVVVASMLPFTDYNFNNSKRVCWVGVHLLTIIYILSLFCNIKSLLIFKHQMTRIQVMVNEFASDVTTMNMMLPPLSIVCMLSVALHFPAITESILWSCELNPTKRMYSYYLLIVVCAVNPLVYVWRYRECRLQGLVFLAMFPCCQSLEKTIAVRRMHIFNIPMAPSNAPSHMETVF